MKKLAAAALCAALCLPTACSRESETRALVPVPRLPDAPVELRVAYLVNERLPALSPQELQTLLDSARETVKAHFGRELRFSQPRTHAVSAYFDRLEHLRSDAGTWIYDFKNGRGDLARLKKGFENDLRKTGDDLDAMIDYARPHLLQDVRARSYEALSDALVATQLARLGELAREAAPDGVPLIDDRPYNEVIYWDAVGHANWPYEVIVTNQLIASVEYTLNSVHSALRGGISNGITSSNPHSRLATTAVVSTYPFYGRDPVSRALRGGETYTSEDAARFAGVLLAHELGHQLFHLGHPYGRTECVMSPTPLLRFRQWVEALVPARCPIGSDKAMMPGTVKFPAGKTN